MNIEINPCPFCGNTKLKVESKHHGTHYYTGTHSASVRCSKCHARGPTASCKVEKGRFGVDEYTKEKAIALWNNLQIQKASDNFEIGNCEGCKHIGLRYPCASMYPCNACVRAHRKDYYNVDLKEDI